MRIRKWGTVSSKKVVKKVTLGRNGRAVEKEVRWDTYIFIPTLPAVES